MYKFEVKKEIEGNNPIGFYDISDREYFARPEVSNSDLNKFNISPLAYLDYKSNGGLKPTPQMQLGSLVHAMYLEPDTVEDVFVRQPKFNRRTKVGKEMFKEFEDSVEGRAIVEEEVYNQAEDVSKSVLDRLGSVVDICPEGGYIEVAAIWKYLDVRCRGKIDFLGCDGVCYDLKTTSSLKDFSRSVAKYGYHRQAAFYGKAMSALGGVFKGFKFIIVETKKPYDCAVLELDLPALKRGKMEVEDMLRSMRWCQDEGQWPGIYEHEEVSRVISLPRWY